MNWGVEAVSYKGEPGDRAKINSATTCLLELGFAKPGESVILTAGHKQKSGGTDMLRILKLY